MLHGLGRYFDNMSNISVQKIATNSFLIAIQTYEH